MTTQNVNVARFARKVECDFFCNFQTLCWSWTTRSVFCLLDESTFLSKRPKGVQFSKELSMALHSVQKLWKMSHFYKTLLCAYFFSPISINEHTGAKSHFLSLNSLEFDVWNNVIFCEKWYLKIRFFMKNGLLKCDFC